jgi:RpiR family transcriptional regulator, carbohydrate utilization regulator
VGTRRRRAAIPWPGTQRDSFRDLIKKLSPRRREVVRPVLENPREYVLLSIRALGQRLGADPATMLRIVRGLGFRTYRDFQHYLHDLSIVMATPLAAMQDTSARDSDLPSHIRDSLNRDLKNLHALAHSLDVELVGRLVKHLYSARRILIFGGDMATSLVIFLEYNLTVLGLPAVAGTSPGRITHLVRTVGRGDVVIGVSFRRGLRQTVEGLEQARAKGAYCLGITDTFISPVARFSNESFLVSIESPMFAGSYTAPMALLNILLIACADYRRTRTIALLREAETEQRTGYRWYYKKE